jgi:anti-sigma28 factor (negative regulator of flagellin synthesis)
MDHAGEFESYRGEPQGDSVASDGWDTVAGDTAATEPATGNKVRRRVPDETSPSAAQAIAENPVMLRLAGRLISGAVRGSHTRFERVEALREAIEAGAYGVSSGDLADKLMDGMRVDSRPGQARSGRAFS